MNRKNIEKMIPVAVEELKRLEKTYPGDKKGIASRYFGYIDSFGPTIIQSGLHQALVFYSEQEEEQDEKKKADRNSIVKIIKNILSSGGYLNGPNVSQKLVDLVPQDIYQKMTFKNRILEAIIACKLAMKLFKRIRPEDEKKAESV